MAAIVPVMSDPFKAFREIIAQVEREAYQRGHDDAVKKIMAAAQPEAPSPVAATKQKPSVYTLHFNRDKSVVKTVQDIIATYPGQRGTTLVDMVAKLSPGRDRKSVDRTVRTALMRLKKRQIIEPRDGKWWMKGEKVTPPVGSAAH